MLTMLIASIVCFVTFLGSRNYLDGVTPSPSEFTQKNPQENQLIQTVLDIPQFQRVSKLPFLKRHKKVLIFIKNESANSGKAVEYNLNIGGQELTMINSVEGIDLTITPCYEFHILSYSKKQALIWVKMDATGAYAEGKLDFLNGKWVPNQKFRVSIK